jgi:hypothetical protein
VATQLDLFDYQLIASRAILRAFVGMVSLVGCRQILSRKELLRVRHEASRVTEHSWDSLLGDEGLQDPCTNFTTTPIVFSGVAGTPYPGTGKFDETSPRIHSTADIAGHGG